MQSKINGEKGEHSDSVFVQRSAAVYKIAQNSHSLLDKGETAAQSGPQSAETPTRKSISDISKDQLTVKERVIKDKEFVAGEHSDDSHAENLQSHSAYIENLIHEDPGQTECACQVSDRVERRATQSGDEDGQQTSSQSLQKHSNTDKHPYDCLSHQLTSHQTPFAEHAQQQRRVSEHGATLTQSQNSPWQFNHLQHSHNSANAYGWSNNSEVNSELVEKNAGGPNQNK